MKKRILIGIAIAVPIITIMLVILMRLLVSPTNQEVIDNVKKMKCYKADVQYIFSNTRGDETENAKVYFDEKALGRIVFQTDRERIYKRDKVIVKDNIANKEYSIDKELNDLYKMTFLRKLLEYPINQASIQEGQEEWGEKKYLYFEIDITDQGNNAKKAIVYIDKDEEVPIGVIVYNKENKVSLKIIYNEFEKMKKLDEDLL